MAEEKDDLLCVGRNKGFSLNNLIEPLSHFAKKVALCSQCKGLLRNPRRVRNQKRHICKLCSDTPEQGIELDVIKEAILELDAKCPLQKRGCQWTGKLGRLGNHMDVCEELKIDCPQKCHQVILRKDSKQHTENNCLKRSVQCKHCNAEYYYQDTEKHENVCQEYPLGCTCGESVKRKEMQTHKLKVCLDAMVECNLRCYGCNGRFKRRDRDAHDINNSKEHDGLRIDYLEKKLQTIENDNAQQKERIRELEELSSYALVLDLNINTRRLKNNYQTGPPFQIPGCDIKLCTKYAIDQGGKLKLAISVWGISSSEAFSHRFWTVLVDQETGVLCRNPAGNFKTGPGRHDLLTNNIIESTKVIAEIPVRNLEKCYRDNNVVHAKIYCRKY